MFSLSTNTHGNFWEFDDGEASENKHNTTKNSGMASGGVLAARFATVDTSSKHLFKKKRS